MVRMARARTSGLGSAVSCKSHQDEHDSVGCTHFDEGVHGEDDKLGLRFGVIHEVQVDQLLLLQIFRLLVEPHQYKKRKASGGQWCTHHVLDDIWEQSAAVLPNGMIRDDPFDGVGPLVAVLRVELLS